MGLHIYHNSKGQIIPSVTEIIYTTRPQSETIKWAKIAEKKKKEALLRGEVYEDNKKEEARERGTKVHELVEQSLLNIRVNRSNTILLNKIEENNIRDYYKCWLDYLITLGEYGKDWEVIEIEKSVVSERYQYGGKLDLLLRIGDRIRLIDVKTFGGYYHQGRGEQCYLWNFWRSPKTYQRKGEKMKEMIPEQPGWEWVNDNFGCKNAVRQMLMYYLAATEQGLHIDQLQVLVLTEKGHQEIRVPISWFWKEAVADVEGRIATFYLNNYQEWKEKAEAQIVHEKQLLLVS